MAAILDTGPTAGSL